jgi:hypothetical protein
VFGYKCGVNSDAATDISLLSKVLLGFPNLKYGQIIRCGRVDDKLLDLFEDQWYIDDTVKYAYKFLRKEK